MNKYVLYEFKSIQEKKQAIALFSAYMKSDFCIIEEKNLSFHIRIEDVVIMGTLLNNVRLLKEKKAKNVYEFKSSKLYKD